MGNKKRQDMGYNGYHVFAAIRAVDLQIKKPEGMGCQGTPYFLTPYKLKQRVVPSRKHKNQ
jgi:hypothetical protein